MPTKKPAVVTEWSILKFFWKATTKYKLMFLGGLLLPLGYLAMNTFLPYYTGKLLAALGTDPSHAAQFLPYLIGIGIIGVAGNRYGSVFMFRLQARVIADLQTLCLSTLLKQSASFHNDRVSGKLVSDAIEFPQAYQMLSSAGLINIIPLLISLLVGVGLVMHKSWTLGLVLLFMVLVTVGAAIVQSNHRKPIRARRMVATKAVTAHLADSIVNNVTVKTFGNETAELDRHKGLNNALLDIRLQDWAGGAKAGNARMAGLLVFQLLFAFIIIGIVKQDPSMLAIGIFAYTYSISLGNNLFSINTLLRQIEDAFLQAEPIMAVLQTDPSIVDKPDSRPLNVTAGKVSFNAIDFSYKDNDSQENVFSKLQLHIAPGEKIGLVGTSGGGKTTLTRLLLRFDDVQSGSITIDGQDISKVTQRSLRQAIAYVPQEPLMFHRTVAENIAYGKLHATHQEIVIAAEQANAHEFITGLADGYDTLVGERGVKLSGGQRQRVAIARAILKNAPILLLDEATSALDSESEVLIQKALQELMKGRTTIVIAHRLSTIQKMDRIIVLQDGRITEEGTHRALLAQQGTYAMLWAHQSGGFLEEEADGGQET